jgi:hypothetical protein
MWICAMGLSFPALQWSGRLVGGRMSTQRHSDVLAWGIAERFGSTCRELAR